MRFSMIVSLSTNSSVEKVKCSIFAFGSWHHKHHTTGKDKSVVVNNSRCTCTDGIRNPIIIKVENFGNASKLIDCKYREQ